MRLKSINEAHIESVNQHLMKALEIVESHLPHSKEGDQTEHLTYIFREMLEAAHLTSQALALRFKTLEERSGE